jgi:hypothetical protein
MGRDKRMYRFVQDSRFGRVVLAESNGSRDIAEAVTKYVVRRMIDRERMLAGEELSPVRFMVPQRGKIAGVSGRRRVRDHRAARRSVAYRTAVA